MNADAIANAFVGECSEREIGLWSVIWEVRCELNDGEYPLADKDRSDPRQIRAFAMDVVWRMLANGVVVASFESDGSGLSRWAGSAEQVFRRIVDYWDGLGGEPSMTDNIFFIAEGSGELNQD